MFEPPGKVEGRPPEQKTFSVRFLTAFIFPDMADRLARLGADAAEDRVVSQETTLHLGIDGGEDLRHRPARSANATDDLEVETALTFFPEKGEIRRAESPVFAEHFESTKPLRLLFLAVCLDSDDIPAASQDCTERNSGPEESEKAAKMTVKV